MNEREECNVYYIPSNYTDSGKWLWGMVEPRNCVEAIVVAVLLGAGILSFNFSFYVRLVLLIVIVFPIFALACFGYKGDSLTQFLGHLFKHFKTRKKLTFRRTGQYEEDLPDKKMGFVQEYIPVEEIRDGIVETTDGRYIKILEIEPINFSLRSDNEREDINLDKENGVSLTVQKVMGDNISIMDVAPVKYLLDCFIGKADDVIKDCPKRLLIHPYPNS